MSARKTLAVVLLCVTAFAAFSLAKETRKATCSGKVVDPNGKPTAAVRVKLYRLGYDKEAEAVKYDLIGERTTRADGEFAFSVEFDNTEYRQSIVLADKPGLAVGWATWAPMNEDKQVDIELTEPKELAGIVVDDQNSPVPDAEVSIQVMVRGEKEAAARQYIGAVRDLGMWVTKTDSEGRFSFGRLPAGAAAELMVKKPGLATFATLEPSGQGMQNLHYIAGLTGYRLTAKKEAIIEGKVVEKRTGAAAGGVRITSGQQRRLDLKPITTQSDGTFRIDSLAAGKYALEIVSPRDKLGEWAAGAEPVEVEVEAGRTKSGVTIEVAKGGVLEIPVIDSATKKPLDKARVGVSQQAKRNYFSASADKEGVARFRLVAGEYTVSTAAEGYTSRSLERPAAVEDGNTTRIEIELQAIPRVRGVVRDDQGEILSGAKVAMFPRYGPGAQKTTDAKGRFEVEWQSRMWPEQMTPLLVVRHEKRNLAAVIPLEGDNNNLNIRLSHGVTFTGQVVDLNDKPIKSATASVMLRTERMYADIGDKGVPADADGRFEAKAIPPGQQYLVTAKAAGYGKKQLEAVADNAENFRLDLGTFALVLADMSVSGIVVDVNDNPVADVQVYASGGQQPDNLVTKTDKDGKFNLDKVCGGDLYVNANLRVENRFMYGSARTQGGAQDAKVVIASEGYSSEAVPALPSLVGKRLPSLNDPNIILDVPDLNDKMVLVCFWDMTARSSRHFIKQLATMKEELEQKGVAVIGIHASKVDESELRNWLSQSQITFPVGIVQANEEKVRLEWGVGGFPWLILAYKDGIVKEEGFALSELTEKIDKFLPK